MKDKIAIVIPTYNEKQNIEKLLVLLRGLFSDAIILVVDDNSPDKTFDYVAKMSLTDSNLRLLLREKRSGMASAYIDAFARIIPDETIKYIVTMDADLSHNPEDLIKMLAQINSSDVVIGSRYVKGGKISNWALWRYIISKYGSMYTSFVTALPINDVTSGFVIYRREVLMKILTKIRPKQPYAFQTEMKYIAFKEGAKMVEIPITFKERTFGKSKLKLHAILEAVFFPWYLRLFR